MALQTKNVYFKSDRLVFWITFLLALLVVVLLVIPRVAAAQQRRQQPPPSPLQCYTAGEASLTSQREILELCCGQGSIAPLQCYQRVQDETMISSADALSLCRCAVTTEAADCYIQADDETLLSDADKVRLCTRTPPVLPFVGK